MASGSGAFDLADLCACNYHVVTTWTDEASNVLTLTQDVSSSLSGDTLRTAQVAGTWSGSCLEVPSDSTVTVDPLHEHWQQVGPGHMRVTYVETYRISGTPHLLSVQKDLTYSGGGTLPYDEVFTVKNISTSYNAGAQTQHDSDDLSLAPFGTSAPIWSPWMTVSAAGVLLALGLAGVRKRRITG